LAYRKKYFPELITLFPGDVIAVYIKLELYLLRTFPAKLWHVVMVVKHRGFRAKQLLRFAVKDVCNCDYVIGEEIANEDLFI
jgi:hypothetical protein